MLKETLKKSETIVRIYETVAGRYLSAKKRIINSLRGLAFFDIGYIRSVAKHRSNEIIAVKPVSLRGYVLAEDLPYRIVEDVRSRIIYEPPIWDDHEEVIHHKSSPSPIYITELSNATVVGGTGIVLLENGDAVTDMFDLDSEGRVNWCIGEIRRGDNTRLYLEVSKEIEEYDAAINLTGVGSNNYYHLTFEILSRYAYLKDYDEIEHIPVLLDEDAGKYPQFIELTKCILREAPVKYIRKCQRIRVRRLIYPSLNTWMPNCLRKGMKFRFSDYIVSESAVKNLREATSDHRVTQTDRRIYISRKNTLTKRLLNDDEVAKVFETIGFQVVYTEELSYREQIELFSSAKCIVGCDGAALTNMVYCNPGTTFVFIASRHCGVGLYSTIAFLADCNVIQLEAKEVSGIGTSSISYELDMEKCQRFADYLNRSLNEEKDQSLKGH